MVPIHDAIVMITAIILITIFAIVLILNAFIVIARDLSNEKESI